MSTDVEATSGRVPMISGTTEYRQRVPIFTGVNTIEVTGLKTLATGNLVPDKTARASVKIECDEDCIPGGIPISLGGTALGAPTSTSGDVVIAPIAGPEGVKDVGSVL